MQNYYLSNQPNCCSPRSRYKMQVNGSRNNCRSWFDFIFNALQEGGNDTTERNYPLVDIKENDKAYLIETDLPQGISKDDVSLTREGCNLTISVNQQEEKNESQSYIIRERRKNFEFSRSFCIPDSVDREKIEAHFEDGLIRISLPRKEEDLSREIKIQ